ncbi:hypothetical protein ACLKA6_000255 [Drosophila palustris]
MPADSAKNAAPEMVTMPAGQAESGPRKPVFHPGLGVEGVILPPQITSEPKQSALSAAEASAGAKAVGEAPTAGARKKFSYTERRSAGDILQRHHNNAGSNLSADWLRKVEWAKSVIPDWQQSSRALAQAKRQRSQEAPAPSAKKSRVQAGKSFAQIARERILIGVLDRGSQDGRIPRNQWRWVESALATQCLQLLEKEPGPPPICKDVGWYQGNVKVIACDDNRSAELYKAAVSNLGEVYPGAKLAAVDWEEVPVKPRARMWFPSTIKEPEQLLRMLQRCNPSLPTHDWRVAKIEETPGPTHQAVIILNKESLAPIDAAGGELNFGFSSVFIRVYKSDAAVGDALPDKPVEEDIVAELEAPERPDMEGYTSDASSLTRDLKKLWQAGDLEVTSDLASDLASDEEDANITAASAALLLRLAGGGADIVLIQEPWVVGGKVSGLGSADYKLFVANAQAVSLELRPAPIRLLSSYMAYDQEGLIPEDIARSLVSDCASNKIGLIICCDANAHHTQWGSSNVNTRGCSQHSLCSRQVLNEVPLNPSLFSPNNIAWAINSFKPFKSPGPDGIAPAHLQHAGNTAINWLQSIFTGIFRTGAMRTTPSDALDAILNIPPIRQISIDMSTLAAIRLRDLDYWKDHLTGHSSILLKNNNIPSKTDYCMPTEHMATPFHTLIPKRDEWTSATPGQEGALSFYTDGSKLDNQNSLVGRVARQSWPHIDKARSNALCNLSRRDCSLVIRSLTGHWLIGIHAQRLNSPYNDFCRSCRDEEEEESPEHIFCFCPALSSRRFRFWVNPS